MDDSAGPDAADHDAADHDFVEEVGERLAGLPGVEAVALGGSRAEGTSRPDSDWDFAIYYRGGFQPQSLRDLGWPGQVSELGGWGGGVFNGGAWLEVEGRPVDVHYRDLQVVEHELAEARAGRFHIEPLLFHLAGIPSYLVVAELGLHRPVCGVLPRPAYPAALRTAAPPVWWDRAQQLFGYARANHAAQRRTAQCIGLVVQACSCAAHAILAGRGEWVTNEKALLTRSGLQWLDDAVAEAPRHPAGLEQLVDRTLERCRAEVQPLLAG